MKYEKPEVSIVANAVDAVQCQTKVTPQVDCTAAKKGAPAYEADE